MDKKKEDWIDDSIVASLSTPSRLIYVKDIIVCGKPYLIDDYNINFVYTEDSTEPTHFVIKKAVFRHDRDADDNFIE